MKENRRCKRHAMIVTLDISKALYTAKYVWTERMMETKRVPGGVRMVINEFLRKRTVDVLGEKFGLKARYPQGSTLRSVTSPCLLHNHKEHPRAIP